MSVAVTLLVGGMFAVATAAFVPERHGTIAVALGAVGFVVVFLGAMLAVAGPLPGP